MKEQDLPERWRKRVREHALQLSGGKYATLGVSAFGNHGLRLEFDDGSTVVFRYAFALIDEEHQELGVFTEHCGYHIFPLVDTRFEELSGGDSAG